MQKPQSKAAGAPADAKKPKLRKAVAASAATPKPSARTLKQAARTPRKQTEQAPDEWNELIWAVMDQLPIGVAINSVDPNVAFSYMNENFPKIYRTTREALAEPGAFWQAVYEDPSFRDAIKQRVMEDVASGDPHRMNWEDVPVTRKGEDPFFICARNILLKGTQMTISTVWDTTERKRAEEDLKKEKVQLRTLIDNMPDCIFVKDTECRFVVANVALARRVGTDSPKCLIGKTDADIHPAELARLYRADDLRVLQEGITLQDREERVMTAEGDLRWSSSSKVPLRNAAGDVIGLVGISRDITARKQAEAAREKLEAQLRQAQKMESVGRLAGGVAHDFNNMLQVILGHTEIALAKVEPGQPLLAEMQEIRNAAKRAANLTRQLLAFARKQTIAPTVLDLNETVQGMLTMLRRLIGEDIDLLWKPGGNLWPIKVDPSQIDQLLANLCVNARDAIADVGKITIETGTVTLDEAYCADHVGFVPGNFVMLVVSDNGCGMDPETLGHLFEPFFTTKQPGRGTGLGLASVYGMVKQNRGFINVYSEPGQGTVFRVYLPRHAHAAGTALSSVAEQEHEPVERGRETILLVEDDAAILSITAKMLEGCGYTVVPAATPGEAIRLAQTYSGSIHLLITDVVMPEMNGRDLAGKLLAFRPNLKRLFMSGYTSNVVAHHGVLENGVYFIQKPFSRTELAAKVHRMLREK